MQRITLIEAIHYNGGLTRSALVLVLAMVFVALLAVDPLVCADGCRDDGGKIALAATFCVICLGLGRGEALAFFPFGVSLPSAAVTRLFPEQVFSDPIEHPPQQC